MNFGQSVGPPSEVETGDGVNQFKVIRGRETVGEGQRKVSAMREEQKLGSRFMFPRLLESQGALAELMSCRQLIFCYGEINTQC